MAFAGQQKETRAGADGAWQVKLSPLKASRTGAELTVEGKNRKLQATLEARYFAWPPAEDNAVLRLARERLLGGASRHTLAAAALQQGLIQITRDYCDRSNAICEDCRLPAMVAEWRASEPGAKPHLTGE